MCGIAGGFLAPWFDVEAALDRIAHRGPDGRGVVQDGEAIHGHVRLAIIDPTPASAQPFRYGDGVLSFVGEVWNYRELRAALQVEGCRFRTGGDTEVLAAALWRRGSMALDSVDGMFAFAWTSPRERLLARDRYGKVPLYRARFLGGTVWASERKGLGDHGGAAEPVAPGTVERLDDGGISEYYAIPDDPSLADIDVEAALLTGVRRRLVTADVPTCVLLSGGLDSSLISAMAASVRPGVVAYTCAVTDDAPDLAAAREVAAALRIEHRVVMVPAPDVEAVARAVAAVELSSKVAVELAVLCLPLARAIRADGFKVVLAGEAADELFGGYGTLARRAGSDAEWIAARRTAMARMGRINFVRVNKSFMAYGVEARLPFCERALIEGALNMGVRRCPPGKRILVDIATRWLPRRIARRQKLAFQDGVGGGGTRRMLAGRLPAPARHYNAVARGAFGRLVRG